MANATGNFPRGKARQLANNARKAAEQIKDGTLVIKGANPETVRRRYLKKARELDEYAETGRRPL